MEAARDRATPQPAFRSARQLVQVYNAGSMPTTPDNFFACHPATLDGAEQEGGTGTPLVDNTVTLFVDFLHASPDRGRPRRRDRRRPGRWVSRSTGRRDDEYLPHGLQRRPGRHAPRSSSGRPAAIRPWWHPVRRPRAAAARSPRPDRTSSRSTSAGRSNTRRPGPSTDRRSPSPCRADRTWSVAADMRSPRP